MKAPVWAKGRVVLFECPVSQITGASRARLEQYAVWKLGAGRGLEDLPSKTAEAFLVLEREAERTSD